VVSAAPGPLPWIADLDRFDDARAIGSLAPLFEGAPRFLARLVGERPFWSWDRLFERARDIAHQMPQLEQIELLDAHPRLGSSKDSVSALSAAEQGLEGQPRGAARTESTLAELGRLNTAYEARFGFRYCVFVAGRPLASLIPAFERALASERNSELSRGLDAVIDIAIARHAGLSEEGRDR
jgi:2-oxo-4-hydroxy-4-carboxy--5-ureidoimidazoline (OHCU) decarboxylase